MAEHVWRSSATVEADTCRGVMAGIHIVAHAEQRRRSANLGEEAPDEWVWLAARGMNGDWHAGHGR
jgi:hypothetical protein